MPFEEKKTDSKIFYSFAKEEIQNHEGQYTANRKDMHADIHKAVEKQFLWSKYDDHHKTSLRAQKETEWDRIWEKTNWTAAEILE